MRHFLYHFGIYMKFTIFCQKNEPNRSIISGVLDSERWFYLNASQGLFLKIFWKWFCYLGPKTPEICRKVFCPTFSSFLSKLSEQKLFLIRSKNLELLLNTLTANYELSRSNRDNLPLPIQSKLPKRAKSCCCIFFNFLVSTWNLQCSGKKWPSYVNYFWSYWLWKMGLFKCITGLVSENLLEVNLLTRPKNSWNLQKSIISAFFSILINIELAKAIFNQISDFRTAS